MTNFVYARHSVEDFDRWKAAFDAHASARAQYGGTGTNYIMRNADDPNEVVIIMEWGDLDKGREFVKSEDLKQAMQGAGVTSPPEIRFLTAAG